MYHYLCQAFSTIIASLDLKFINLLCSAILDAVLRYAVKWNMNSKHCHAAQYVLSTVLNSYTPEELNQLPSIKSTVEALLPYTGNFLTSWHCKTELQRTDYRTRHYYNL